MRLPGVKTAKHISRWLSSRLFGGALILGYHRVAYVRNDSFYNCVSPNNFEDQMEVLSRYANPISLENLVVNLASGDPLPKTVCVTIDDGYAETLTNAKPILEKYEIPATVFVTTGNLGGEFWWDELERYILNAPEDVSLLRLGLDEHVLEKEFPNTRAEKQGSQILAIANILRPLDVSSRNQLLNDIREWSGSKATGKSSPARSMTPEELVSLAEGGLIHIGSHTVTHPILSELSEVERRYEIEESKRVLEEIIAKPILGFSYPNGRYLDSDPDLLYRSGYRYACASHNGVVRANQNHLELPRFWIPNINGKSFQKWLKRWL